MRKYRLAVCKGPDCRRNGADAVFETFRREVLEARLGSTCELYRGGCYGLCHLGPNVVVRQDDVHAKDPFSREDFQLMGWEGEYHYAHVKPAQTRRIVREHIGQDCPIDEYLGVDDSTV